MSLEPPERDGDGDDEPKISVDDPDDYNLTRRFRQIHGARDHVKDVAEEYGRNTNDEYAEQYRELLAQSVASYAIELEPLMTDHESGERIWTRAEIDAPRHPEGKLTGIEDFVTQYGRIQVVQEYLEDTSLGSTRTREEVLGVPDVATIMRIYRLCNTFCREIGLDVRVTGDPPAPDANPIDPAGRFNE